MKVEVLPSGSSYTDDDRSNLKQLLEAFGSVVSLEDIASAYCETGRNLNSTAEILCNMKDSISGTSLSKSQEDLENTNGSSSGSSSNSILVNAHIVKSKSKKYSASMGTVSDVIGNDYIRPRPQPNGLNEKLKPVKLNSDDFPVSAIWDEKKELASTSQRESMDNDLGEFLCKMLGNVYQLDMSVIKEVIGQCGYNVPMSMDKLLDLSAATLEKSDDVIGIAAGNTSKNSLDVQSVSHKKQSPFIQHSGRSNSDAYSGDELILSRTEMKKKDIQREVLEALFSAPDRIEEKQKSTNPIRAQRHSPYGQIVAKPPEESLIEDFTFITRQVVNGRNNEYNEENQDNYDELRIAVLENWVTMKEYYKASVDAYMKKDYENAQNLLEQGNFYMRKAREADEKSAKILTEESDEEEEFSINMHYLEPKDALHHMRLQLTTLCGLPSVRYLKAVVGTDSGVKKDGRRKHLITKLLEEEGIPWTEEGNGWIICVRVDEIDPTKLSFANK